MEFFRRLRESFNRAGMTGRPPSADDPRRHALDFARRYAEDLDLAVSQRMLDLGIHPDRIGFGDPEHGIRHAAFHPHG